MKEPLFPFPKTTYEMKTIGTARKLNSKDIKCLLKY